MSEFYWATDPLVTALYAAAGFAILCWLLSVTFREYSWVDRLWSIAPVLYAIHFAAHARFSDARMNLMAALALLWGIRLTYNYARKGGYKPGGEDYRWEELQRMLGPVGFHALNATFIAPLQNLLLMLLAVPSYIAYQHQDVPVSGLDYGAAVAFVLFFVGEAVADEQQWRFQTAKYAAKGRGETVSAEFLTSGLFAYSRHPNFFCEQAMWWSFYVFSVAASGRWLNWSIVGAVILTMIFQGSTWLTERISAGKYPAYADYQKTTSRFFPWFPKTR